jgi:excinuclease ABC subunit C
MNFSQYKKIVFPDVPGVYLFKKNKDIIYIGKATSLKDRVRSYFSNDLIATRGPLILDMVFQADNIDFIQTDSVLEALILESNLIKKHQPRYNTKEKDDRSYNYVIITKEVFPRVLVQRGKNIDFKNLISNSLKLKAIYGPFTNGTQLKEALKIVRKIFPFIDDKSLNNTGYKFYKEIGLAPETKGDDAVKDYKKNIKNISLFFMGKKIDIIKNLEKEMKVLAKKQEFEKAGQMKRTIFALNHIQDVALIKDETLTANSSQLKANFRIEAYDIAHISGTNTVGVMTVVENGEMNKNEYRKFSARGGSAFGGKTVLGNSKPNDTAALGEILRRRLNHEEWKFPDIIVVDGSTAQKNIAEKTLKKFGVADIIVVAVTKDERHRPKMITGREEIVHKYESEILIANSEAHRFAIKYHRNVRSKII